MAIHDCLVNSQKVMIFLVTLVLVVHGFLGALFGGFWIALNLSLKVLFQENKDVSQSAATTRYLKTIDLEPIDNTVTGAIEIYQALLICCASCCELKRMLRVMCVVLVIFLLHGVITLALTAHRSSTLHEIRDDLFDLFIQNFRNLYRDTNGTDKIARFTFEMDGIQVLLSCCGVNDYVDYANTSLWKRQYGQTRIVPRTCCHLDQNAYLFVNRVVLQHGPCMDNPGPNNSYIEKGCFQPMFHILRYRCFFLSMIWQTISSTLYLLTLLLFVFQIRESAKQKEDPFAALRDGRFLDEAEQIVQQLAIGEAEGDKDVEAEEDTDGSGEEGYTGHINIMDVVMNITKKLSRQEPSPAPPPPQPEGQSRPGSRAVESTVWMLEQLKAKTDTVTRAGQESV